MLGLTACGGGGEADIPTIQEKIEGGIHDQLGQRVTVDCPSQIDWEAGEEFHCFAEDGSGQSARVTVTMENDDGEWSWQMG